MNIWQKIINFLKSFSKPLPPPKPSITVLLPLTPPQPIMITNQEKLFEEARAWLGRDASPMNLAPKEYACAESVTYVLRQAGFDIGIITGTATLRDVLIRSWKFTKVLVPEPGDIILCTTGMGNGNIPNGHVGICLTDEKIASNNSYTGLWSDYYTFELWKKRYVDIGGYKIEYFRVK